jgi:hypothetical protein
MHPWRRCAAIWLLSASSLLVPFVAWADEDLPAKREACRAEARRQIKPRSARDASLYEITLKARETAVRDCMARAPLDLTVTGSVEKAYVLPPKARRASPATAQPRLR